MSWSARTGDFAITTSSGYRDRLVAIRLSDGKQVGNLDFPTSAAARSNGLYYGLAFGPGNQLLAAMGAAHKVAVISLAQDGSLTKAREFETGAGDFPAGLATDARGRLFVTHNDPPGSVESLAARHPFRCTRSPAGRAWPVCLCR